MLGWTAFTNHPSQVLNYPNIILEYYAFSSTIYRFYTTTKIS